MNNKNSLLINASNLFHNTINQDFNVNNHISIKDEDIIDYNIINSNLSNNIVIKKIVSYKLINKYNDKYNISNVTYIGNNYFITILKKEDYEYIYRLKSQYYIKCDKNQLEIITVIPYSSIIENNFIVVLFIINNKDNIIFYKFDVINPSMYLQFEQNNIELSYEVRDTIIFNNKIISISDNYLEIEENNKLKIGSPLFNDNILIGIHYRDNKNSSFFYRLSKLFLWLNTYSIFKNKELKQLYVSYSKEELFNIILCLNERINRLEKKIENSSKN